MQNLKHYQSHKKVHARPMTRGEFIQVKKRPLDGGSPDDLGYFVVYSKDTKDHYESWSPKDVFDEGYTEIQSVQARGLVRVFMVPEEMSSEFCSGGGVATIFTMVDWFRDDSNDFSDEDLINFVKSKGYYKADRSYILMLENGSPLDIR